LKNIKSIIIVSIDTYSEASGNDEEIRLVSEGIASRYARRGIYSVRISVGPGHGIGNIVTKTKSKIEFFDDRKPNPSNLSKLLKHIYETTYSELSVLKMPSDARVALITIAHGAVQAGPNPYFLTCLANAVYRALTPQFNFAYFSIIQCHFALGESVQSSYFHQLTQMCQTHFRADCPVITAWETAITVYGENPERRKISFNPYAPTLNFILSGKKKYEPRSGVITTSSSDDSSESDVNEEDLERVPRLEVPLLPAHSHYRIFTQSEPAAESRSVNTRFICHQVSNLPQTVSPVVMSEGVSRQERTQPIFINTQIQVPDLHASLDAPQPTTSSFSRDDAELLESSRDSRPYAREGGQPQSFYHPNRRTEILLHIRSDLWTPHVNTPCCDLCGKAYTLIRRPHHCRSCGSCICGACSHFLTPVGGGRFVSRTRFCSRCVFS